MICALHTVAPCTRHGNAALPPHAVDEVDGENPHSIHVQRFKMPSLEHPLGKRVDMCVESGGENTSHAILAR